MKLDIVLDKQLSSSGIKHYHNIDFKKTPHILTSGATGSGKTFLNKLIIGKVSLSIPDSKVTVLDFKADDYHFARGSPRLFEFEATLNGLNQFYDEFKERQEGKSIDRSFRLLVIEELGSMLGCFGKKEAESIKAKIANLVFLGRSFNTHILVSTQRPDASLFNSGVRDSINCVIALGNLSKEGKSMLFSGFQDEMAENHEQGSGYMLTNGTQLHSVIVPHVTNVKKLEDYIILALTR